MAATLCAAATANVTLPSIFSDHMVLEQQTTVRVWGWAKPFEKVSVSPSWTDSVYTAMPASNARWSVEIATPEAGGPHSMTVSGYNSISISDILVGEVWMCSGQSNMEWSMGAGFEGSDEAIASARQPEIRFFNVDYRAADTPQFDATGRWCVVSPETVGASSAIGYFIAERLHGTLGVPVGIINSSWGGTPIEAWTDPAAYAVCDYLREQNRLIADAEWGPVRPGQIYNAMLAPLGGYRVAGVAWYQGEHNVSNPSAYTDMMYPLVDGFRRLFGAGADIPFVFAQIAPYNYGPGTAGAEVRERQRLALQIPNTAMVVLSDLADTANIHPRFKRQAGQRFADAILAKAYGRADSPLMGPIFRSLEIKGSKAYVSFDHAEGLCCRGKALDWFEISADGQTFVPAKAVISGEQVVVSSPKVKRPVAVRFGWSNVAMPNLFNGAGLPASCFNSVNQ